MTTHFALPLALPIALLLVGACEPARNSSDASVASAAPAPDRLTKASRLYADALDVITARYLFATNDPERVTQDALDAYLASRDAYSGRLTRDQYARYRKANEGGFGGIGMGLERLRDGATICYPAAHGPAERAGVHDGERLVSIDGASVRGKPLPLVAALATGREGTPVELVVSGADGAQREVRVVRTHLDEPSVTEYDEGVLHVLKIPSFTTSTKSLVAAALAGWDKDKPIVIDLRGSGGGSFFGALDTAMLFLKQGAPIVTVTGRTGAHTYTSTRLTDFTPRPVFLWQDAHTASAAEVLIAALVDNGLALSIGEPSAGKGTRQDVVELSDGSALILTTGYLSTPRGLAFDHRGLAPMRALPPSSDTAAYARATLASQ
ncbi:PDZ domain-containing protein [Paraburkholderia sp. MMS20-SJTN17]|uniref:PDZ domain-containing protein n=1 Tax=Paraburkholderia translucens TaxID=2886945 RepID=A0ABS8K739_9BURK|nr:S41 family peptidase [Paraburkholderia sp. MMS20-SJTN17]MCC8400487.1 PDZ domain-containing protein [Paraburkholderia sp. MMS20-SJTN17]